MKPRMIGLPGKATKPKPPKWVKNGGREEMNLEEAIRRADQRVKNDIPMETKKRWLDGLQAAVNAERRDTTPITADVAEAYLVMRYALDGDDLSRYNTWAKIFNNRVTDFIIRGARA